MRCRLPEIVECGRITDRPGYESPPGALWGAFRVLGPNRKDLLILSSGERHDLNGGWEHVSVSCSNRCPNWPEMAFVKDLFWGPDECVVQYHPPEKDYVNNHPGVLHLWKAPVVMPMPPKWQV